MFLRPSGQGPNIYFLDLLAGAHIPLAMSKQTTASWQVQTREEKEGRNSSTRDYSSLHRSMIHFHGVLFQNYQLVKVLHFSSFSAPVAKIADLAYLTTTENRSILCGSRRAENIFKNNIPFKDDALVKLYPCQMGFSFSIHHKASKMLIAMLIKFTFMKITKHAN